MNINYTIIGIVILVILAIWFLISKRNRKDKTELEDILKNKNNKADSHNKPHV